MSRGKVGVLRFPGTNCDRDVFGAIEAAGHQAEWLWHADSFSYTNYKSLVLPGGFSYGDYLRAGALAARSPVMKSVREAAQKGVPILGICNGFQILCEAGLLPGVLTRNESLRFNDDWVTLNTVSSSGTFASELKKDQKVRLPVAHADGRYHIPTDGLKRLQDNNQIWFTYEKNPNGSLADIAGVFNETKNVAALMPHPERAMFDWMGSQDGFSFFE
jgi:phosphoribosylformylglycinamidine synthase